MSSDLFCRKRQFSEDYDSLNSDFCSKKHFIPSLDFGNLKPKCHLYSVDDVFNRQDRKRCMSSDTFSNWSTQFRQHMNTTNNNTQIDDLSSCEVRNVSPDNINTSNSSFFTNTCYDNTCFENQINVPIQNSSTSSSSSTMTSSTSSLPIHDSLNNYTVDSTPISTLNTSDIPMITLNSTKSEVTNENTCTDLIVHPTVLTTSNSIQSIMWDLINHKDFQTFLSMTNVKLDDETKQYLLQEFKKYRKEHNIIKSLPLGKLTSNENYKDDDNNHNDNDNNQNDNDNNQNNDHYDIDTETIDCQSNDISNQNNIYQKEEDSVFFENNDSSDTMDIDDTNNLNINDSNSHSNSNLEKYSMFQHSTDTNTMDIDM